MRANTTHIKNERSVWRQLEPFADTCRFAIVSQRTEDRIRSLAYYRAGISRLSTHFAELLARVVRYGYESIGPAQRKPGFDTPEQSRSKARENEFRMPHCGSIMKGNYRWRRTE